MILFTADPHYGHDMIIVHCNRPFRTAKQMDNTQIRNHNLVVSPDDDVYIAGDFSMYGSTHVDILRNYVRKLNGRLHLIGGNHDIDGYRLYEKIGFTSIHYPYLEVEEYVVVHDPALSQVNNRDRMFVGGHIHDMFKTMKNFINVGVDVMDFTPVSIDKVREIEKHMKTKEGGWT